MASSTLWRGSASPPTTPRSKGRTTRARRRGSRRRGPPALRGGPRVLLRPDAGADPGAVEGERHARLRRLLPRPRPRPGPGRVLRFRTPDGRDARPRRHPRRRHVRQRHIEDFALLRGNGTPMFLLANVVDDIEMGISHVVRGEEHLPNTPKQQLLWPALGKEPPVWAHVPVLVNEPRKKLSKRRDKVALEQYRDEGYLADGDGQLPHDARLVAGAGGVRDRAVGGDRAVVPARGRHPLAGVLRPQEAGRVQRRLHPDDRRRRVRRRLRRRGSRPTTTGRCSRRWRRTSRLGSSRSPRPRDGRLPDGRPAIDEDSWPKAMHQPWSRAVLAETIAAYVRTRGTPRR